MGGIPMYVEILKQQCKWARSNLKLRHCSVLLLEVAWANTILKAIWGRLDETRVSAEGGE
jgi:hypothetical protein